MAFTIKIDYILSIILLTGTTLKLLLMQWFVIYQNIIIRINWIKKTVQVSIIKNVLYLIENLNEI